MYIKTSKGAMRGSCRTPALTSFRLDDASLINTICVWIDKYGEINFKFYFFIPNLHLHR